MPASSKSAAVDPKRPDAPCRPTDGPTATEHDTLSKAGKRKTKHAARQPSAWDHVDQTAPVEEMGPAPTATTSTATKPQSILGQLPHGFPVSRTDESEDWLSGVHTGDSVSGQPPSAGDAWCQKAPVERRSVAADTEPARGGTGPSSPLLEPGFSTRGPGGPFAGKSPPLSPPQRKSRPVSYSGGLPPVPAHPRMSTSPYGYALNAYGSPPTLPHLPQQHFYGPRDVDLGLVHPTMQMNLHEPIPLRFAPVPGRGAESRDAVLLAQEGTLLALAPVGEKLEPIGALQGVKGEIVDATLLSGGREGDAASEYRPLVALTIFGRVDGSDTSPAGGEHHPSQQFQDGAFETRVVVYSLAKSCELVELLRVPAPAPAPAYHRATPLAAGPVANLRMLNSNNYLVVASGESGEAFVFAMRKSRDPVGFECLGKYWTTIPPQHHRRDSSHGPSSDADVSPADLGRGLDAEPSPILSLHGRWLAFCPANTPSRRSIGVILGDAVVVHPKTSNIAAGTAPPRPLASCDVESPDVDTFLSKVAKGFAQEAVKSAKWISEKGMQTWQNYWKKETTSPGLPATSSSPPIYSPRAAVAQFPPTHAADQPNLSLDPEVVTILDLDFLRDGQGRKSAEQTPMTTFQPPGGCSFLSFAPTGLALLTSNRKGDVQYIWDLMQMKHVRCVIGPATAENPCVRQVARYERLSPSTIVDIAWCGAAGYRFALLTKNRTVHIFDVPKNAVRWPPRVKKPRPTSAPIDQPQPSSDHDPAPAGGFFASAISFAGRTQPILANLRGRAPSMPGGITGIAPPNIGLASTTGMKSSGRAVAAGLSKSLGAATETVTSLRHANQSRMHLKTTARVGMLAWQTRNGKAVLSILEPSAIKSYFVRMTKPREDRHRDPMSVFDARRALAVKFPKGMDFVASVPPREPPAHDADPTPGLSGFWKSRPAREGMARTQHPLASAEIETNAPYQPFNSDRRVTVSMLADEPSPSAHQRPADVTFSVNSATHFSPPNPPQDDKWVFGTYIHTAAVAMPATSQHIEDEETDQAIYRETKITSSTAPLDSLTTAPLDASVTHVVSSTKKRKTKKGRAQAHVLAGDGSSETGGDGPAFGKPSALEDGLLEDHTGVPNLLP